MLCVAIVTVRRQFTRSTSLFFLLMMMIICFVFFKVPVRSLPYLPDCPVANLAASTFVGNVECVCSDVKCQSQIRIKPIAGTVC